MVAVADETCPVAATNENLAAVDDLGVCCCHRCFISGRSSQSRALLTVPEVGSLPDDELAQMLGLTNFSIGSDELPDAASFIERLNKDLEMEHGIVTEPGSSRHKSE